jgi:hypothetical protein
MNERYFRRWALHLSGKFEMHRFRQRRQLSAHSFSEGVQHRVNDRNWCGHDRNYWRDMLPYYLSAI